jgi:hypothetical protein
MSNRDLVLLKVARCPTGNPPSAPAPGCRKIISAQGGVAAVRFQVPEPWRGDIVNSRLLFVASNPALNPVDDCPTAAAPDTDVVDYYNVRGFPPVFPRNLLRNGAIGKHVPFWSQIRNRAAECYGVTAKSILPGHSFALTEVVHCKSNKEQGVADAATECIKRHFGAILTLSCADVIVILGDTAANALGVARAPAVTTKVWWGRSRLVTWLPHPNARKKRTFATL